MFFLAAPFWDLFRESFKLGSPLFHFFWDGWIPLGTLPSFLGSSRRPEMFSKKSYCFSNPYFSKVGVGPFAGFWERPWLQAQGTRGCDGEAAGGPSGPPEGRDQGGEGLVELAELSTHPHENVFFFYIFFGFPGIFVVDSHTYDFLETPLPYLPHHTCSPKLPPKSAPPNQGIFLACILFSPGRIQNERTRWVVKLQPPLARKYVVSRGEGLHSHS